MRIRKLVYNSSGSGIPPIKVFRNLDDGSVSGKRGYGQFMSLDNRRLFCFKQAGVGRVTKIPVIIREWKDVAEREN